MLKFRLFFSCYGPSETVTVTVSQHVNRKSGSNYLGPFLELTSCTHQSANCSEVATVGRLRVNVPTVRTRRKRSPVTRHTLCPLAASLFLVLLLQVLALHSSHNAILHSAVSILLGCWLCTSHAVSTGVWSRILRSLNRRTTLFITIALIMIFFLIDSNSTVAPPSSPFTSPGAKQNELKWKPTSCEPEAYPAGHPLRLALTPPDISPGMEAPWRANNHRQFKDLCLCLQANSCKPNQDRGWLICLSV